MSALDTPSAAFTPETVEWMHGTARQIASVAATTALSLVEQGYEREAALRTSGDIALLLTQTVLGVNVRAAPTPEGH